MKWSKYYLKALLIIFWEVGGPFLTRNGITIQTKAPQSITKKNLIYLRGL